MTMMDQPLPLIRTNYEGGEDNASVTRSESRTDMASYHRHLESIHNTGLHGWGIAAGLQVNATLGETTVRIAPGIAVQGSQVPDEEAVVVGKHISLASGGYATINEDDHIRVAADGVSLATSGLKGDKYLAIQFHEFFDLDTCMAKGVCNIHHAPRLRFLDSEPAPNDGSWLVLARLQLDANGRVLALSTASRQPPDLPAGSLHLWQARTTTTSNISTVENVPSGELTARPEGGLNLAVAQTTDELHLGAQTGTMARLSLAAQQIVATRASGDQETIRLTPEDGTLSLGAQGVAGSLHVNDAAGNTTITLHNGEARVATLTASGVVAAGSLTTTGEAKVATLTANGAVAASSLTTTGEAKVAGLTVSGSSKLLNTVIEGKLDLRGELSTTSSVRLMGKSIDFNPGTESTYMAKTDGFVFGMAWSNATIWLAGLATNLHQLQVKNGHVLMPVRKGDQWYAGSVPPLPPGPPYLFTWTPLGVAPFPAETLEKISDRAPGVKRLSLAAQQQSSEPKPEEEPEEKTLVLSTQQIQQLQQMRQMRNEREQDVAALVNALDELVQHPGQKTGREQLLQALNKLFEVPGNES